MTRRNHLDRSFSTIRAITRIMRSGSPLSKKLAQSAEMLPGIADGEIACCAEIEISEKRFVSRTFAPSDHSLSVPIIVSGEEIGTLRLYYHGDATAGTAAAAEPAARGQATPEESEESADLSRYQDALAIIADLVGYMVEHSQAHRTMRKWEHAVSHADWGMRTLAGDTLEQVKRQTQLLLQKEQQFLHALMDSIPDHIYFKDPDSRFLRINEAHARWLGLRRPDEAVGKSDFDFFSAEHARQAYEDEQRIMATGKPMVGVEEKETWEDGEETWVSTTKVPLIDQKGRVYGLVGISRKLTPPLSLHPERPDLE